jgi:hypothetical protein
MADEERAVPDLPTLLADANTLQERLDKGEVTDVIAFLKNDLVGLIRDTIESTLYGFEDVQDEINPIKLTGGSAKEMLLILQASLQVSPHMAARLQPLIDELAEQLGEDEDDEEDEEEDQN